MNNTSNLDDKKTDKAFHKLPWITASALFIPFMYVATYLIEYGYLRVFDIGSYVILMSIELMLYMPLASTSIILFMCLVALYISFFIWICVAISYPIFPTFIKWFEKVKPQGEARPVPQGIWKAWKIIIITFLISFVLLGVRTGAPSIGSSYAERLTQLDTTNIDGKDYALIRIYGDRLVLKGVKLNKERNKIESLTDSILIRNLSSEIPSFQFLDLGCSLNKPLKDHDADKTQFSSCLAQDR